MNMNYLVLMMIIFGQIDWIEKRQESKNKIVWKSGAIVRNASNEAKFNKHKQRKGKERKGNNNKG